MGAASIAIIIFSIVGIGFGAGMHLGLIDDSATMYKIQNLIPGNLALSGGLPFFDIAFMSGQSQGLISQATVSFGLGKIVVDKDTIPNSGDEYYDNLITECEFHSEEDIDEPICIVCRIKNTHEECVDKWMGLDEFEHGLLLNTQIPGVTVSAHTTHGFPEEIMIFVSDNNVLNDDDPDLETEGVGGICTDCLKPDGEGMHIAVIPEYITGSAGDGIVDVPDDSGWGGTQRWVFDQPWFLKSFDFVDYDRDYNGEARAYDNPACSGTPVATAVISKNPNGGDGSVQTITLNANNVLCLEVEYEDSGGITNIHLECIKSHNLDDVIGTGFIALPEGYTASSVISIPLFDGGVDVFEAQSVSIEIGKAVINFAGLSHGDGHGIISGYLFSNFGIDLEIDGFNGIDQAIIYNSFNVGGADPDLEHPLNPDDQSVGNLLVMKENSGNQPNDSAAGGIIRFKSADPMTYASIDVVDHDNNGASSEIRSFENSDCTGLIDTSDIVSDGNNNLQTVQINDDGVRCLEIFYEDSGGFTNLLLGCTFNDKECEDQWMGLDEFEHGLLLNTQIPGVTVSAVANGNFPDEVMIFVSDNNNLNDDDPDLETEGVGGICTDCLKANGEGMHIAVIPEFITGSAGDGVVDVPDDSGWGGTQTWVFDQPWFLRSFDFVDYDRDYNGDAKAYANPDCTGLVGSAVISKNPFGGDGSVQTITLNANNVRCLEVSYEDSGGITNIHLECPHVNNEKITFFDDSFEDESTIWGVWYDDNDRTTTPHPDRIWFGQASSGEIGAHSGQFYLGGSGNIDDRDDVDYDGVTDPAWAAKNRYIDISEYTDIWLSFWYSYDNTESSDEFAMYYRVGGGAWQEIFLIDPATQSNQQVPWQFVEIGIPDGNGVEIQFRWETSAGSGDDIVMIDELQLSGFLK